MMHVYFVQESGHGLIKIGRTKNIEARLNGIKNASPHEINLLASIKTEEDGEVWFHNHFKKFKANREWYRPTRNIRSAIKEINNTGRFFPYSTRSSTSFSMPKIKNFEGDFLKSIRKFPKPKERKLISKNLSVCDESRKQILIKFCNKFHDDYEASAALGVSRTHFINMKSGNRSVSKPIIKNLDMPWRISKSNHRKASGDGDDHHQADKAGDSRTRKSIRR